jgi:hypothetical protein
MNRRRLKLRLSRRCLQKLGCLWQVEIDQLATIVADGMVMPVSFSIVTTGAVAKFNLVYQPGFFQEAERVVNGRITNCRQLQTGRLENLVRGWMVFSGTNNLQNGVPLTR